MTALALALSGTLAAIALLHAHWAFGGLWPAGDEHRLVGTVVGDPRLRRMPGRRLTLAVVTALTGAAAVALLLRWPGSVPESLIGAAGAALVATFIARGIAGYVPAWRLRHAAEPFATLDRRYYSPLCLLLGCGFLLLLTTARGSA